MNRRRVTKPEVYPVAPQPRYLTVVQAAQYMGVGVFFVRCQAKAGNLPHSVLGNRFVFDREDLDKFVASKKVA